ncbi:hypothetical protein WN943_022205 [Citrus x changshan-huyou]
MHGLSFRKELLGFIGFGVSTYLIVESNARGMKINASSNDVQRNEIVVSSLQFVLPQNSPHPRLNTVIIIQEQTNNQRKKKIKNSKHKAISRVNSGLQNEPIPRYQGFI